MVQLSQLSNSSIISVTVPLPKLSWYCIVPWCDIQFKDFEVSLIFFCIFHKPEYEGLFVSRTGVRGVAVAPLIKPQPGPNPLEYAQVLENRVRSGTVGESWYVLQSGQLEKNITRFQVLVKSW